MLLGSGITQAIYINKKLLGNHAVTYMQEPMTVVWENLGLRPEESVNCKNLVLWKHIWNSEHLEKDPTQNTDFL